MHVPEVEHKEAKSMDGAELDWDNLLLSCKYCNTRKGVIVKKGDKENYLWPDQDDTFHVFSYDSDIPKLNEAYLQGQDKLIKKKAENIYNLIKLGNTPSPERKDRRYLARNEARNCAIGSKNGWDKVKETSDRQLYLDQIEMLAKATGFFSTWMNVFKEDQEVKSLLISTFKGTKKEYCLD